MHRKLDRIFDVHILHLDENCTDLKNEWWLIIKKICIDKISTFHKKFFRS
jgi:hypothetical protein